MNRLGRRVPSAIRRQVETLRMLNGALDTALPPALQGHLQAAALERNRLVLETDSPVWATRARYLETDIIRRLRDSTGLPIQSLKLQIRPATVAARPRRRQPPRLSTDSGKCLNALAGEVSDPGLQKALTRLAGRASRGPDSSDR